MPKQSFRGRRSSGGRGGPSLQSSNTSNGNGAASLGDLPPHSVEAERGALGCILLAGQGQSQAEVEALLVQLRPSLFYDFRHKSLYQHLVAMKMEGHAVDLLTLSSWLHGKRADDECGGRDYVLGHHDITPSVANFGAYLKILKDKALRRWTIAKSATLQGLASGETLDQETVRQELAEIMDQSERLGGSERPQIEVVTVEEAKAWEPDPKSFLVGTDTICRGELTVIAGWPGLGKSRLSTTLAVAGGRGRGDWMGYGIPRKFRTFILQSQNPLRRLKSEVEGLPKEVGEFLRFSKPCSLSFHKPEFRAALRRFYESWPFDCLIIDPWNVVARDEGASDYIEAIDNIRSCFPSVEESPAIVVVAHLRKQRGGDNWLPKVGRALLDELSGSFALGAEARTVFVLQPATLDMQDDRVILDCAKSNNDKPLPMSAWYRRNGAFEHCQGFDFDEWLNPPDSGGRKKITEEIMAKIFDKEGPTMSKRELVKALEAEGFATPTAYRAADWGGKFNEFLWVTDNGRLGWRQKTPTTKTP